MPAWRRPFQGQAFLPAHPGACSEVGSRARSSFLVLALLPSIGRVVHPSGAGYTICPLVFVTVVEGEELGEKRRLDRRGFKASGSAHLRAFMTSLAGRKCLAPKVAGTSIEVALLLTATA